MSSKKGGNLRTRDRGDIRLQQVYATCAMGVRDLRSGDVREAMVDPSVCQLNGGSMSGLERFDRIFKNGDIFDGVIKCEPVRDEYDDVVATTDWQAVDLRTVEPGSARSEFVTHAMVIQVVDDSYVDMYSRRFGAYIRAQRAAFVLNEEGDQSLSGVVVAQQTVVCRAQELPPDQQDDKEFKYVALAVEPLKLIEINTGIMYQVCNHHTVIYNNEPVNAESIEFRYVYALNSLIGANGRDLDDWYGRKVSFTACVDQPGSSRREDWDRRERIIYKVCTARIIPDSARTDTYYTKGVWIPKPEPGGRGRPDSPHDSDIANIDEQVISEWEAVNRREQGQPLQIAQEEDIEPQEPSASVDRPIKLQPMDIRAVRREEEDIAEAIERSKIEAEKQKREEDERREEEERVKQALELSKRETAAQPQTQTVEPAEDEQYKRELAARQNVPLPSEPPVSNGPSEQEQLDWAMRESKAQEDRRKEKHRLEKQEQEELDRVLRQSMIDSRGDKASGSTPSQSLLDREETFGSARNGPRSVDVAARDAQMLSKYKIRPVSPQEMAGLRGCLARQKAEGNLKLIQNHLELFRSRFPHKVAFLNELMADV